MAEVTITPEELSARKQKVDEVTAYELSHTGDNSRMVTALNQIRTKFDLNPLATRENAREHLEHMRRQAKEAEKNAIKAATMSSDYAKNLVTASDLAATISGVNLNTGEIEMLDQLITKTMGPKKTENMSVEPPTSPTK